MKKITFGTAYKMLEKVTPAPLLSSIKKTSPYRKMAHVAKKYLPHDHKPSWQTILAGPLKGYQLFVDPKEEWLHDMLQGNYDEFFFKFLDKIDLTGKTVFDIGAHLGFHTLHFAQKVGKNGSVIAFEPNPANVTRLEIIMDQNKDNTRQVQIMQKAVSDKSGTLEFMCTDSVDDGSSCGGFIDGSDTFFEKSSYETQRGFHPIKVQAISLDEAVSSGLVKKPDLIKIDIEGAEHLAVKGALEVLKKYNPILLIEIHSKFNDVEITKILNDLGYKIDLLKKEEGDRCFISAVHK